MGGMTFKTLLVRAAEEVSQAIYYKNSDLVHRPTTAVVAVEIAARLQ